ncbi:hypothetical protein [Chryseobacterium sp.]|uniref:hypothetical protein n=1 Tax=Chryseobacterium sp. TaxID=1871047 RepID=UPI0011CB5305|nr:hypothetical protein [Chryseobacterium sp.]TXF75807.1 hypothetical protein FUA25_07845 [Chryseobacterium sp.]
MKRINLSRIIMFVLLSCIGNKASGQDVNKTESVTIKPFEVTILDSDYSRAYSVLTILTNKELKIVFKSDLVGGKDSVLFSRPLQPSDILQQISIINLDSLKEYYSNDCIADGSQVTVTFKKNGTGKTVHLSNFYQEDVGKIIGLINSLVPDKYKVWYDKKELITDYKRCKGN